MTIYINDIDKIMRENKCASSGISGSKVLSIRNIPKPPSHLSERDRCTKQELEFQMKFSCISHPRFSLFFSAQYPLLDDTDTEII